MNQNVDKSVGKISKRIIPINKKMRAQSSTIIMCYYSILLTAYPYRHLYNYYRIISSFAISIVLKHLFVTS